MLSWLRDDWNADCSVSGNLHSGVAKFWSELKRRKVIQTTIGYVIGAWVLIEVSATVFPALDLPEEFVQVVVIGTIIGLPIVIVLAWVFDIHRGASRLMEITTTDDDENAAAVNKDKNKFPPAPDSAVTSVAILPFEDLSESGNHRFLGEGIATELHSTLSKAHRLRIIARNSSFAAAEADSDIKAIANKLNARFVISGSVRCINDQIRVIVELDNALDGIQIWSGTYDRNLGDLFAVQRDIALAVTSEFGGARLRDEIAVAAESTTHSIDAWTSVQRARSYVVAFTPKALAAAVPILRNAISLDPEYSMAHAALASVIAEQVLNGFSADAAADRDAALESAKQAFALSPVDPFVLKMCGATWAYFGDSQQAIQALRSAVDIAPFDFGAWGYLGWPLVETGSEAHLEELQQIMERLLRVASSHPGVPYWLFHRSVACTCEGDNEMAVEFGRKSINRNPAFPWAWMQYANALGVVSSVEEGLSAAGRAAEISPLLTPQYYERMVRDMSANGEIAELRLAGFRECGLLTD